jgi:hypothetical protein
MRRTLGEAHAEFGERDKGTLFVGILMAASLKIKENQGLGVT